MVRNDGTVSAVKRYRILIAAGVVFDRMGSFTPILWGIGGLMAGGVIALGMGLPLKHHTKMNKKRNQTVRCASARSN